MRKIKWDGTNLIQVLQFIDFRKYSLSYDGNVLQFEYGNNIWILPKGYTLVITDDSMYAVKE